MTTTTKAIPTLEDIEEFLLDAFEQNFERIRSEAGHGLSPEVKETAKQQVLLYWRRLHEEVAVHVTDTEVRLSLPGQTTPAGRGFCVEGIVDIVREDDRTTMYDIKTHDPDYVRGNLEMYEQQLNVYAHIWQALRGQDLDEIAVIATPFPRSVRDAWDDRDRDPAQLDHELANWDPVIPLPFRREHVEETIRNLGEVVDQIEDGCFGPPPVTALATKETHDKTYAQRVCLNCDARFTCRSFRDHIKVGHSRSSSKLRQLFDSYGHEEQEDRLDAALPDKETD